VRGNVAAMISHKIPIGGSLAMYANPGDIVVTPGRRADEHERQGEILEVCGADGGPPFIVRWLGGDHTALLFPGSSARIRSREVRLPDAPS
jgi:hypothetical protein